MTHPLSSTDRIHRKRETYVVDIETYPNVFLVGIKRLSDGKVRIFEQSHRETIDYDLLRRILMSARIVTFNGKTYDAAIIWQAIEGVRTGGFLEERPESPELEQFCDDEYRSYVQEVRRDCTNAELKLASDRIIQSNIRWWDVERELGIEIPRNFDHIDLIEPQPNPFASLKILNGRMHGRHMQDLPYDPDDELTDEQIDQLRLYLHNDLAATELLWNTLREPIELREKLSETVGVDLRSMSDTQMGLAIIKKRCEDALGHRLKRDGGAPSAKVFRYEPPTYLRFESPVLRDRIERLRDHQFIVQSNGKVELPNFLTEPFRLGASEYAMGIGGLHSMESNRAVRSDLTTVLVDADVASYYPAIILSLGLYPQRIGPVFLDVYRGIRDDRVAAKRRGQQLKREIAALEAELAELEVADGRSGQAGLQMSRADEIRALLAQKKAELKAVQAVDKGLKISANGTFGSLGSPYKIVYAPDLMIAVTLTGQLALLMLIERAETAGIPVASANTDGVLFQCPRSIYAGISHDRLLPSRLAEITEEWERETQFDLEFNEYWAVYSQSVNSYFAIKANGGHKRKGPLGNPWNQHPDDFDPVRGQLMKNQQATICSDAALARIKHGTPVSETIRGCRDVRQFVTVIKVTGGATWRGDYLGKVVRYYWGTDGDDILRAKPNAQGTHGKVQKTDGCRPLMTFEPGAEDGQPWALPEDIDYTRYEAEAETILRDLGFYGEVAEPVKFGVLTERKLEAALLYLLAA